VPLLGADGARVSVIPAGRLDAAYLEKLARLDFVSDNPPAPAGRAADPSPIERALSAILVAVFRQLKPDYVLLDSRAGLHDLAGLSLHSLAHVDVLVSPATEQAYLGFDLTLGVLAKRKGAGDLRTVVVHALAPPEGLPDALVDEAQLRHRSYEAFCKYVYKEKAKTIPEDAEGLHQPVSLRRSGAFERFLSISKLEAYLFGRDYTALRKAIEDKCAP
jgi:MinD-like ATPase involved in chromosome partitioning or flagellar assembly